jgi:hypothetical protein
MKIEITLTIDVDPAKWDREYGVGRAAVEDDIRRYVRTAIQESEGMQATDAEVTVR